MLKFNIKQRKSLVYKFPGKIIKNKLCNHFMRGYFDGDGCFSIDKNNGKKKQLKFALLGTFGFLNNYHKVLLQKMFITTKNSKPKKYKKIARLLFGGNILISKIATFLYKDATIYLDRKYNLVKHLI